MRASLARMGALMKSEFFVTRRSLESFFDIIVFPMINVVLFGLIAQYLGAGDSGVKGVPYLLLGILFWQILSISQYCVTMSSMWTVWSHNLSNMFIAPVSVMEYLVAYIGTAFIKTFTVVGLLAVGTYWVFDFNLLDVGLLNLALFVLNLGLFGCWLGVILLGLIFRYGTRIQSVSWGVVILFQPLVASFFPVSVLPPFLQVIAYSLPATYVFEAARQALGNGEVNWLYAAIALGLNLIYLTVSLVAFHWLFKRSKESGQFARNDA